jgi:hypothetical protein
MSGRYCRRSEPLATTFLDYLIPTVAEIPIAPWKVLQAIDNAR